MTALSLSISRLLANIHHQKETVKAMSDLRSSNPLAIVTAHGQRLSPKHVHPIAKVQNFVIASPRDGIVSPLARTNPAGGCINEEKMTSNLSIDPLDTQG